ncbi:hypothetical protein [Arthrobacter castelli]|uniref:hypothetical protein n=1 Tax=Arthrobacter castelli TaxID=271431 RepID=UPI0003F6D9DF|nr:hypothetical protein [Arthrobacter castelli]
MSTREADAVERAVAELTDGVRLLYFDEFHVHDSGDGTGIAGSGNWLAPGTREQLANHGVRAPEPGEATDLRVRKRQFTVVAARPEELWTTFAQTCEATTSSIGPGSTAAVHQPRGHRL